METTVISRFLRYIAIDTQSEMGAETIPSTEKQFTLARMLVSELEEMGASDVRIDEHCYVYATVPSTADQPAPVLGLIAHMDTSPDYPGGCANPRMIRGYDGGEIVQNDDPYTAMGPEQYPDLLNYIGRDLITTDGTTLLGGDDKAGVAEIMALAEYLLKHPEIPHGTIRIAFTPDEEVGRGTDLFDVAGFGADVAYTLDGGEAGGIYYENFNAAAADVTVHGLSIHPGSSKNKMKNAVLMAMELQSMLPPAENPMYTEGYEGFYHLNDICGNVEQTKLHYIIRDHDMDKFLQKKAYFTRAVDYLNEKYGAGTFELSLRDSYYNMKEKIMPHLYLIDLAEEAMRELGITPHVTPIRGGTDGARLSFMGLPCPNLGIGAHNGHGRYEFVCIQSMEQTVELMVRIAEKFTGIHVT